MNESATHARKHHPVAGAVMTFLFASVGYLVLQLLLTPVRIRVLTTILDKDQYALLTLIVSTTYCAVTFLSLGSFEYLLRKLPGQSRTHQLGLLRTVLRTTGSLCLLGTVAAGLVLWLIFRPRGGLSPSDLLAIALGLPLFFWLIQRAYFFLGTSQLLRFRITQFFYADIWFVAVLAVSLAITLTTSVLIWTWVLWLALAVAATWRWVPLHDLRAAEDPGIPLREILAFSVPLLPMILGEWLFRLGDRYVLLYFMNLEAVANYTLCMNISMIVYMVGYNLIGVVLPELNKSRNDLDPDTGLPAGDSERMRDLFTIMLRYSLVLSLVGGVALVLVGRDILVVLSNQTFWNAAFIFPWAAPVSLFFLVQIICTRTLMAFDRSPLVGALTLIAALLNLGLNLVLVPRLQERGAALATVLSLAFLALSSAGFVKAWRWIRWRDLMPLRLAVVVLLCTAGIYAARSWLDGSLLVLAAGGGVSALLIFGSGLIKLSDLKVMVAQKQAH